MVFFHTNATASARAHHGAPRRTAGKAPKDHDHTETSNPANVKDLRQARLDYLAKTPEERRRPATAAAPAHKTDKTKASQHAATQVKSHGRDRTKAKVDPRQTNRSHSDGDAVYVYGPPPPNAGGESNATRFHGALNTSRPSKRQHHGGRPKGSTRQSDRHRKSSHHSHRMATAPRGLTSTKRQHTSQGRSPSRSLTSEAVSVSDHRQPLRGRSKASSVTALPAGRSESTFSTASTVVETQSRLRPLSVLLPQSKTQPTKRHAYQSFREIARAEELRRRRQNLISALYFHMAPKSSKTARVSASAPVSTEECIGCFEDVPESAIIKVDCGCAYCKNCLIDRFKAAVKDPIESMPVTCCQTNINPKHIYPHIKHDRAFISAFCKASRDKVHGSCRCPKPNCGKWIKPELFHEVGKKGSGGRKKATCPACSTAICHRCKSPWHKSTTCPDDAAFNELLSNSNWQRCRQCGAVVEKTDGCLHMTCPCGHEFCYRCGEPYTRLHACGRPAGFDAGALIDPEEAQREEEAAFMAGWRREMGGASATFLPGNGHAHPLLHPRPRFPHQPPPPPHPPRFPDHHHPPPRFPDYYHHPRPAQTISLPQAQHESHTAHSAQQIGIGPGSPWADTAGSANGARRSNPVNLSGLLTQNAPGAGTATGHFPHRLSIPMGHHGNGQNMRVGATSGAGGGVINPFAFLDRGEPVEGWFPAGGAHG